MKLKNISLKKKKLKPKIKLSTPSYKQAQYFAHRYSPHLLLVFAISLALVSPAEAFDEARINCATNKLLELIEGAFGALIMVVAGLIAIFSAAMGAYRASVGMIVVATGAFILRAFVGIFFPELKECDIG